VLQGAVECSQSFYLQTMLQIVRRCAIITRSEAWVTAVGMQIYRECRAKLARECIPQDAEQKSRLQKELGLSVRPN